MTEFPNSGVLFRNEYRKEGSNQPHYKGNANVAGREYKLAGWIKESKNGGKEFTSLKFEEVEEKVEPQTVSAAESNDSEVPF